MGRWSVSPPSVLACSGGERHVPACCEIQVSFLSPIAQLLKVSSNIVKRWLVAGAEASNKSCVACDRSDISRFITRRLLWQPEVEQNNRIGSAPAQNYAHIHPGDGSTSCPASAGTMAVSVSIAASTAATLAVSVAVAVTLSAQGGFPSSSNSAHWKNEQLVNQVRACRNAPVTNRLTLPVLAYSLRGT